VSILFFLLGFSIKGVKSKFQFSKAISQFLSVYLLIAVGFKGGVSLVSTSILGSGFFMAAFLGIGLSFLLPFIAFFILEKTTKLDLKTRAAVSAHYGSVSLVTFITASAFLNANNVSFAGYTVAVLALMESPAILSGIIKSILHKIKIDGGILILLGAFLIGACTGQVGLTNVSGFLVTPFNALLAFFLFDMGLKVVKNLNELKLFYLKLISFGFYMPLLGASLALLVSKIFGFNVGSTTIMMVLAGSASYIAVPAVLQVALPEAKAAVYLPLSLAITFPFNVVIGISL